MPFVFEQPNLDNAGESHLYFDPGDGRLITVFTERGPDARPAPDPDRSRLRPPHRALACRRRPSTRRWSGSTSAASGTAASRTGASWTRSTSTTHSVSRSSWRRTASSRRSASRTPRCCSRRTGSASSAATTTSPQVASRRCDRGARPAVACVALGRPLAQESVLTHRMTEGGSHVCDHAQHPEAERQQPDRSDLRPGRRARLRRGRRLGEDRRRPSSWPRTRPT